MKLFNLFKKKFPSTTDYVFNSWMQECVEYDEKEQLKAQMLEKRPLPTGMTEFEEWSDRIIAAAMLPSTPESQKFALAEMIMHLKPTEDHEADAYFIKCLRKSAVNQIAYGKMESIRAAAKARLAAEAVEVNKSEAVPT